MAWFDNVAIAFDTETTGLQSDAEIVELAVLHIFKGKVVREWSSFFSPRLADRNNPDVQKALEVNQIQWSQLEGKPTFRDLHDQVDSEMSEPIWVAHNAEFDQRMLDQEFKRIGTTPRHRPRLVICTKLLDFMLNPGKPSYKLSAVAERWGVMQLGEHRAAVDAQVCGEIFSRMIRTNGSAFPHDEEHMRRFIKDADKKWRSRPKGIW